MASSEPDLLGGAFPGLTGQPAWLSISAEITPAYWRIPMAAASQSLFVVGEMYHGRSWQRTHSSGPVYWGWF